MRSSPPKLYLDDFLLDNHQSLFLFIVSIVSKSSSSSWSWSSVVLGISRFTLANYYHSGVDVTLLEAGRSGRDEMRNWVIVLLAQLTNAISWIGALCRCSSYLRSFGILNPCLITIQVQLLVLRAQIEVRWRWEWLWLLGHKKNRTTFFSKNTY